MHVAHGPECAVDVARIDRRRKAILHSIPNFDGIIQALAGDDRNDRPEYFLLRNAHVRSDIAKDGGFVEPATLVDTRIQAPAATQQRRAFLLSNAHVLLNSSKLSFVDYRTDIHFWIQAVTNSEFRCALHKLSRKFADNLLMDHNPACRRASLTTGAETAPQRAIHGKIDIPIVHDHEDVLAAHFQMHVPEG